MRIHYLQHVPFEDLAAMEPFFHQHGHEITATKLFDDQPFPEVDEFDWLIVMGGPMGVYDESRFKWLVREKKFIQTVVDKGKCVLGVCLGAQLIADVAGARVYKNKYREIGWFSVERSEGAGDKMFGAGLPEKMDAFHWHGDTFDLPEGASLLMSSKACVNQAFIMDHRILGFQFHLETTPESARALITHCGNELDGSEYVQTEAEILSEPSRFVRINEAMERILCQFAEVNHLPLVPDKRGVHEK